jgi:signal transduction histidine kinase
MILISAMDQAPSKRLRIEDSQAKLVTTAFDQTTLAGLRELLRCIAQEVGAYGAIAWEAAPVLSTGLSPTGHLFVLVDWFPDNLNCWLENLPYQSVTGKAILSRRHIHVKDVWQDDLVYKEDTFLLRANISTMCSFPVSLPDNTPGAVNLYRNFKKPFTPRELTLAKKLVALFPPLYQAIRDKINLTLLTNLNQAINQQGTSTRRTSQWQEARRSVLNEACAIVASTYQCEEASVFLEEPGTGEYGLVATTWNKGRMTRSRYSEADEGLTGWIISNRRSVRIFDLLHFERDIASIRLKYPGISWGDSLKLEERVQDIFGLAAGDSPPPIAFVGSPILVGDALLGVIRCSIAKKAPFYFSEHEVKLLELVAQQIGLYWAMTGRVYKAETDHALLLKQQALMFEDLTHQLKSPVTQAYVRIRSAVREASHSSRLFSALQKVQGLCGRAQRVVMSARLYKSLHSQEPILIVPSQLTYLRLVTMLDARAEDARSVIDPERNLRIRVDRDSFNALNVIEVKVDFDLLDEAFTTVLDNAVKYSFSSSTIHISGGTTRTGRFQISVLNKGLAIRPDEVRKCLERGWRGDRAKTSTGEGSGVGLWLVDNIMRAHGGDVVVVATTPNGMTEVKLAFPARGHILNLSRAGR